MSTDNKVWIGADPGGEKKFGVAILFGNGTTKSWCVDHADAAVEKVSQTIECIPAGVGVDAPLWWSSGKSSDRRADQWLRTRFALSGGNVQAGNSLKGANLIQGALFVYRMRELYPEIPVTESHPKALWAAMQFGSWPAFCTKYSITAPLTPAQLDERDAIIGAVAAREGFEHRWPIDLTIDRHLSELDPMSYWLAPVHYFWPDI